MADDFFGDLDYGQTATRKSKFKVQLSCSETQDTLMEQGRSNDLEKSFTDFAKGYNRTKYRQLANLVTTRLNQKLKRVQAVINEALEKFCAEKLKLSQSPEDELFEIKP